MAIINTEHSVYVGKGRQHYKGRFVDGGENGHIVDTLPTCTDCGGYERYGPTHGIGHTALCPERLKGGLTDDSRERDRTAVLEALFKTASTLLGLDLDAVKVAVEALGEYAPGRWPGPLTAKQMANEGAEAEDDEAPLFSEAYLYPLFGKDEARTILAKWHAVRAACGLRGY